MNNAVIAYDRYSQDKEKSAEIRIAKVAILIFCLFLISWTPYATIALTGCFGNRNVITPMLGMIPAVAAKIVSCIDPWIYAINHPRFRYVSIICKSHQTRSCWVRVPFMIEQSQ
ncbi:hypothetical protein WDU94_003493 [Cyamophila willieti]